MSDYLPQDLVVNILARLPIKSILRCKTVCKSWYFLISSPNFISTNLNRKQDEYMLIRNHFDYTHVEVYALFGNNERLDNYLDFSFSNSPVSIVGSFNGILCLADVDNNSFYFCNPSIRKSVKLPEPVYVSEACKTFRNTFGFGFDSVTNDYKLVRIAYTKAHSVPPRVDLYKLSTGVWEDITHVSGPYVFIDNTPYVFVNGASHWITSKMEISSCRMVIVVFNMHDETFSDMRLPSGLTLTDASETYYDEMFLFVSEESLCLVDNKYDLSEPIDIWMMREYGAPDSWVKQFSIQNYHFAQYIPLRHDIFWIPYVRIVAPTELEIDNEFMRPMAIRKNGEILWKGNRRLLVSVDSTIDKFKDVDIGNCTDDWCCDPCYVTYYKESLVLPDRWTNSCVGDAYEESSNLWKREPKDGKRAISRAKSKYKMRIASLLHISGLLCVSKMKWKWLRKKGRKSMKVKKPSLLN